MSLLNLHFHIARVLSGGDGLSPYLGESRSHIVKRSQTERHFEQLTFGSLLLALWHGALPSQAPSNPCRKAQGKV